MTDPTTQARALRAWQEYFRRLEAWRKIAAAVHGKPDALRRIKEAMKCS
jgi:hypothetical protein